jgi:hypothetical protein
MFRRHRFLFAAVAVLAALIWMLWRWQPDRQVLRHTERFVTAVEDKDWKEAAALMADDYSDRWGLDKTEIVQRCREVFAQFIILDIEMRDPVASEAEGRGTASARLLLRGRGGPLGEMAVQRAAALREPFTFEWRQNSWKPWDWVLVRVDQPELEVGVY